jgi:hypothetical protein
VTIYSLYKKTHPKTGLKYLGQTTGDPYKYEGSGVYWRRHLAVHGKQDVITEVLGQFESKEELKLAGIAFSEKWNIASSKEWANIIPENGVGGYTGPMSPENNAKLMISRRRPKSEEHKRKISISTSKSMTGIKRGPYKKRSIVSILI